MDKQSFECNNGEEGGREIGDEFYETIEAPKFVDLAVPDNYRPGDDHYWFCMRVGCDQNHEEELDSETIYKNFVLRVMAARSPNIRLRKALYKKNSSLKCPQTAPPKSSKHRVSRLALISSMTKRLGDPKVKVKPLGKKNATPIAKVKKDSSIKEKALTTPRNKKQLPNPDALPSSRNPRVTSTAAPKNRLVAKALVFHSPKKSVTTKSSLKFTTPIKRLCEDMKKLEITKGKKSSDASRKQQRGREVKSRVYDRLYSQNLKCQEPRLAKRLNEKKREENLHLQGILPRERSLATKIVSKESASDFKEGSSGDNTVPESIASNKGSYEDRIMSKDDKISEATDEIMRSDDENKNCEMASDDKKYVGEVTKIDDNKENARASDINRETIPNTGHVGGKIVGKHKAMKDTQKETKKPDRETSATSAQSIKHRRPKPTNPRPFRLRTDERQILKETTLEKKQLIPLQEITPVPSVLGKNSQKKQQNSSQKNANSLEKSGKNQIERCNAKETGQGQEDQPQNVISSSKKHKERVDWLATPLKHTVSSRQKLVASQSAKKSGTCLKGAKSTFVRKNARTDGTQSSPKLTVTDLLGEAKEATSSETSTPSLPPKTTRTIPGEPEFHTTHVPKICTHRAA